MFNNETDGDIALGGGALGRGSICTYNGVEYLEVSPESPRVLGRSSKAAKHLLPKI